MTADYLQSLGKQIRSGCGVVPKIGHRAEPLAAIYPVEAMVDVRAGLGGSDFSLQSLVQQLIGNGKLRPILVSRSEETCFANLNEPKDLA